MFVDKAGAVMFVDNAIAVMFVSLTTVKSNAPI